MNELNCKKHSFIALILSLMLMMLGVAGCSSGAKDAPIEIQSQSFDGLRDTANELIADPEQAAEITGLITQLENVVLQTQNDRKNHRQKIKALNANYDATEDEFSALLASISDEQDARREVVVDIRRKLAAAVSAEEWDKLIKALDKTQDESFSTLLSAD